MTLRVVTRGELVTHTPIWQWELNGYNLGALPILDNLKHIFN